MDERELGEIHETEDGERALSRRDVLVRGGLLTAGAAFLGGGLRLLVG